ncbi:hypothetical protein IGL98_001363 [Enterococcus sp. DIV0840]|uniref:hypothetical protein n=1 Tax=unclassified Enterococcus TaxID=2608891 RepID=UPI001A8C7209|nr:hypothetical protein [Enterococcus sp. DIV0849a]MBO0436118.1 hypothetical protein [Enterococcus sp. DIV0849a]
MESKIKNLIAQPVVKSSAGGGAGSTLVLEFEDKSYIFIWCSWRIEQGAQVIVTSSDTISPTDNDSSPNGFIGEKSPILEGRKLINFNLTPQYDLEMLFDDEYKLRIFCDIGHSREDYNINWELNIPTENISIEINNHFEEHKAQYE